MSQIKIIDPSIKKEEEAIKIEQEKEEERLLKRPTAKDKLQPNKELQLLKKDNVTDKIKKQEKEMLRYYKFRHPVTGLMLYSYMLKTEEMNDEMISWGAAWISRDEYLRETNENYEPMKKEKGKIKLVQSLLDLEIVRSNPMIEKKIRARG